MYQTPHWLERTDLLLGTENMEKLANLNVLIVGLGGVGSFAAEFIARSGVGKMTIVDGDTVDTTNINRQLPALHTTVKQSKAQLMADRLMAINPDLHLTTIAQFLNPDDTWAIVHNNPFDYVLDCIDSITPKLYLIKAAKAKGWRQNRFYPNSICRHLQNAYVPICVLHPQTLAQRRRVFGRNGRFLRRNTQPRIHQRNPRHQFQTFVLWDLFLHPRRIWIANGVLGHSRCLRTFPRHSGLSPETR